MRSVPLWVKLLGGFGALAAACVGLAFVPTGEVAYAPVDPIDLEGKISVDGRSVEPLQGRMYLVGVTERKVNFLQRMLLDVGDPKVDFGPAPQGRPDDGPSPQDVQSMARAKEVAAAIAYDLVGEPVRWSGTSATISDVVPGTPAATPRGLQPGDVVVRVNDTDVNNGVDAGKIIGRLPVGASVVLGVNRGGIATQVKVRTIAPVRGDTSVRSRIGAGFDTIGLRVDPGHRVEIDSGEVVGPSAGLAFALYLYDVLNEDVDLLSGRHVVVSGSVTPDGRVQPVGRIRQKAIAAQHANRDLLLVPSGNFAEARAAVEEVCTDEAACVDVIPVTSVHAAIEALRGRTPGASAAATA